MLARYGNAIIGTDTYGVPEPYLTLMGAEEVVKVHETAGEVLLLLGSAFDGGANGYIVKTEFGLESDLSDLESGSPVSLSGADENEVKTVVFNGSLAPDTRYYYRVFFDDGGGEETRGKIRSIKTRPSKGSPVRIGVATDHHFLQFVNTTEEVGDTARDVQAITTRTGLNLGELVDFDGGPLPLILELGDGVGFLEFPRGFNKPFPIDPDGTPAAGASSDYGLSQVDADRLAILARKRMSVPWHSSMVPEGEGNHFPNQKQFYSAHNGAVNDAAVWMRTAMSEFFGQWGSMPSSESPTAIYWSDNSEGRWFAFGWGPILFCFFNPGTNSLYGTKNSVALPADLPTDMENYLDWTLGGDQIDFFFHPSTGVITQFPVSGYSWLVVVSHHTVGGRGLGGAGIGPYGRGGVRYCGGIPSLSNGEWPGDQVEWAVEDVYGYVSSRPWFSATGIQGQLEKYAAERCLVLMGHDHLHFGDWCDKIPGDRSPASAHGTFIQTCRRATTYADGFVTAGNYPAGTGPNPGYYLLEATTEYLKLLSYKTYLPNLTISDPSDGVTTNGQLVETLIFDGGGSRTSRSGGRPGDERPSEFRPNTQRPGVLIG